MNPAFHIICFLKLKLLFKGKFGLSKFAPSAFLDGANIGHSSFVNSEKNYIFFYKTLWGIYEGNLNPAPKLKNFSISLFNFSSQRKFQKCPDLPLGTVFIMQLCWWPQCLLYGLINIVMNNAFIIHKANSEGSTPQPSKMDFFMTVAWELARPQALHKYIVSK